MLAGSDRDSTFATMCSNSASDLESKVCVVSFVAWSYIYGNGDEIVSLREIAGDYQNDALQMRLCLP